MADHITTPTEPVSVWDAMVPEDAERYGSDILDPQARQRWCSALLVGGLPYLWNQVATVPLGLALDQLELVPGDRVLIFGEAVEGIGFDTMIGDRVGSDGEVVVIDIRSRVLDTVRAGGAPQWHWTETHEFPDGHFDCVFVGQALAHAEDWSREGRELLRVMKPGRRIVLAEIAFSDTFYARAHADVHLEYWLRKMLEGMGHDFDGLVRWNQPELVAALGPVLEGLETFEWRGVELLWGRKPAG